MGMSARKLATLLGRLASLKSEMYALPNLASYAQTSDLRTSITNMQNEIVDIMNELLSLLDGMKVELNLSSDSPSDVEALPAEPSSVPPQKDPLIP